MNWGGGKTLFISQEWSLGPGYHLMFANAWRARWEAGEPALGLHRRVLRTMNVRGGGRRGCVWVCSNVGRHFLAKFRHPETSSGIWEFALIIFKAVTKHNKYYSFFIFWICSVFVGSEWNAVRLRQDQEWIRLGLRKRLYALKPSYTVKINVGSHRNHLNALEKQKLAFFCIWITHKSALWTNAWHNVRDETRTFEKILRFLDLTICDFFKNFR